MNIHSATGCQGGARWAGELLVGAEQHDGALASPRGRPGSVGAAVEADGDGDAREPAGVRDHAAGGRAHSLAAPVTDHRRAPGVAGDGRRPAPVEAEALAGAVPGDRVVALAPEVVAARPDARAAAGH